MKKKLNISIYIIPAVMILMLSDINLMAEEKKQKIVSVDWGIGLNLPVYFASAGELNLINGLAAGARINLIFDIRINITGIFSLGYESGVSIFHSFIAMMLKIENSSVLYLDVPLRVFIRLGTEKYYALLFGGYYTGAYPLFKTGENFYYERGAEFGARVNLSGFFIECSYIDANSLVNNIAHLRIGFGYTANIL